MRRGPSSRTTFVVRLAALPWTAAVLVALVALVTPKSARAASCCGSGHGVGPVLADAERAAVTLGLGASPRVGQWTARGAFLPMSGGDFDRELHVELGFIVRAGAAFQLGLTTPLTYTWKQAGTLGSSGGGVADVTAFARYDLLASRLGRAWPGVALTFAALLPTGRGAARSRDALGADVNGLGTAELRPGIALEKRWEAGVYATLAASVGLRKGYYLESGAPVAPAPRLSLFAAAGPFWAWGLSASLGVRFEREAAPTIGGLAASAASAASAARGRTAAVAFVAYDLDAHWTAVASVDVDLPLRGFGQNEPLSFAPVLGIRRVWGIRE